MKRISKYFIFGLIALFMSSCYSTPRQPWQHKGGKKPSENKKPIKRKN